jgi:hypothetical protein
VLCGFDHDTGENTPLPDGFEQRLDDGRVLPAPDRVERGDRRIDYGWLLNTEPTDEGDKETWAILSCGHYCRQLTATLSEQTEQPTNYGSRMVGIKLDGALGVMREQIPRYSAKRLETFAADALLRLTGIYAGSDPQVTRYFKVASGGAL